MVCLMKKEIKKLFLYLNDSRLVRMFETIVTILSDCDNINSDILKEKLQ